MKVGPFPIWDHCPKCNSALTERQYVHEEIMYLKWHCKACGHDWTSRTWDSSPLTDECLCWIKDGRCLIHKKEKKGKLKSIKEVIEEELPV